jgi:hypothetical protein
MAQARRGVRWRALTAALLAALLSGLAGCDGDEAPSPAPLEPSSPSPTETTGSPAPTLPAAAQGMNDRSAKSFAGYVIDVINHASSTGDVEPLEDVSLPSCQTCNAIVRNVRHIYGSGGQVIGRGIELRRADKYVEVSPRRPVIDLSTYFNDEKIMIPGEDAEIRKGRKQPLTLYLRWVGTSWKVERLDMVL